MPFDTHTTHIPLIPEENIGGSLIHNAGKWQGVLKYCSKELLVYGDVGIERGCVYFDSHLFCLFGLCLFVLGGCFGYLLMSFQVLAEPC